MRPIKPGMPGGMGAGPRNPTSMPPRDPGMGGGPRNPTSMPPRDPGMGGGPRNPMPMPMPRPTSMPMTNVKPAMGMKKGGSASSRADGCAMRGKTKGKIV